MLTCAFTGHRKIDPRHRLIISDLIYSAISHAYDLGYRTFIAGGALGFDTEAARQVILFRIKHPDVYLKIYVPYIDQSEAWSESQKIMYEYVLSAANEVKYISEGYDKDCLRRRNKAMVDDSHMLIAYASTPRSGSGQTIRMAREQGKEVRNLYLELEKDSI